MSLAAGSRIGRYQIRDLIGAGGMGEVYRAHDEKLGRDVAIKVLPPAFHQDADRLARFEREARALASLSHPNIAAIYEIHDGREDQAPSLVLELVEGSTLQEMLAGAQGSVRGPQSGISARSHALSLASALEIARQIADALEAAHERGIIHRDLKPANVKLTPSGVVKLLDFGLAKISDETERADLSLSPTKALSGTTAGTVLGTVGFMSPEQARGLAVTRRADLWAFGCVLYEMLAGRPAFSGDTLPDVLVSILERTPDWSALPLATPPSIRTLLRRCLEKDPRRRLRDAGDARLEIEEALVRPADAAVASAPGRTRDVVFSRLTDFSGQKESPAISPDGKMVAFVAIVEGRRQIWLRLLAGGEALQITRDPFDHESPRWLRDSSAVIYFTRGRAGTDPSIWQISALGGAARRLSPALGGVDISHDGQRVAIFQSGPEGIELVTLSRDGATRRCIARLSAERNYRHPRWSPDDRFIAFGVRSIEAFEFRLEVLNVESGERQQLARATSLQGFTWRPDGSGLIYASSVGSSLVYPPVLNLRSVDCRGENDVQLTFGDSSYLDPDMQSHGHLVASRSRSESDIWRYPVTGSAADNTAAAVRITTQSGHVQTPSVSPDGTEVVYLSDSGGHANLWVAATDGSSTRQITFEHESDVVLGVPHWSPAGDWIVFIVSRSFATGLMLIRPDGSERRPLVPMNAWHAAWAPDGRSVYYGTPTGSSIQIEKIVIETGERSLIARDAAAAAAAPGERIIYLTNRLAAPQQFGQWSGENEIARVDEDGSVHTLARIPGARIPVAPMLFQVFLSPDGEWLAAPLIDGATSNIWLLPAKGGALRAVTDFGNRSVLIGRSVSWTSDSQSIYAAVAHVETDIVLLDGLVD